MLGRTQFVSSWFRIFRGFGWVHNLVLVDGPGFGMVQLSVFPDLGLGLAHFWLLKGSQFGLFEGSKYNFGRRTWVRMSSKFNLSSSKQFDFIVHCVYLGLIQHYYIGIFDFYYYLFF